MQLDCNIILQVMHLSYFFETNARFISNKLLKHVRSSASRPPQQIHSILDTEAILTQPNKLWILIIKFCSSRFLISVPKLKLSKHFDYQRLTLRKYIFSHRWWLLIKSRLFLCNIWSKYCPSAVITSSFMNNENLLSVQPLLLAVPPPLSHLILSISTQSKQY